VSNSIYDTNGQLDKRTERHICLSVVSVCCYVYSIGGGDEGGG